MSVWIPWLKVLKPSFFHHHKQRNPPPLKLASVTDEIIVKHVKGLSLTGGLNCV